MNVKIIATLGGHSALEICAGAKKQGFRTIVLAEKGREKTYTHYASRIVDDVMLLDHFSDLTSKKTLDVLIKQDVLFIPHRYCQVYCDLDTLIGDFPIPLFGNKYLLPYEERDGEKTQYHLMDIAGIPYPQRFSNPKTIDRLVIVKVSEATRSYERAFFFCSSYEDYVRRTDALLEKNTITPQSLSKAVIEEYLIGAQVNFNLFYSPIQERIELLGTDTRRQTNIDGLIRIPAADQHALLSTSTGSDALRYPSYIESGHIAVTVKESLLEQAYDLAQRLVSASKKIHPQGIIGPFALQCAVLPGPPKERLVVFDISLRMPGSPGISSTPYSSYVHGTPVTCGERVCMEIQDAISYGRENDILT